MPLLGVESGSGRLLAIISVVFVYSPAAPVGGFTIAYISSDSSLPAVIIPTFQTPVT
ncbi:hypothetical protein D3C85_1533520 [compost metagenome]